MILWFKQSNLSSNLFNIFYVQLFWVDVQHFLGWCPTFFGKFPTFFCVHCIADPNGLNWTISLDSSTPAWVSLNNRSLTLNTIDFRYNISETTIVSLKIINEKNAWVKYNLTIETDLYTSPSFGVISNITIVEGTQTEVKLELQSGLNVQVVDWTNNTITWIQFDKQDAIIIVNPSNNYMQIQCAKLLTLDSWQNKIYSNEFTIFVIKNVIPPPTLVNTFGPLIIYSGKTKLFIIPDDLFFIYTAFALKVFSSSIKMIGEHVAECECHNIKIR